MAAMYATRAHVYRLVPRGTISEAARVVASVDSTLDRIELEGHGLDADDPIQFKVDQGGALPGGLALLTIYYAKLVDIGGGVKSSSLFQVAATLGGAAIDLTTSGTKPFRVFTPIDAIVDQALELFSRRVDRECSSHGVPFVVPYPPEVVDAVVVLTAHRLVRRARLTGFESLQAEEDAVMRNFTSFKNAPLRDATATASTNRAQIASASSSQEAGRGTIP